MRTLILSIQVQEDRGPNEKSVRPTPKHKQYTDKKL